MSPPLPEVHIRQLLSLSDPALPSLLQTMSLAFSHDPFLDLLLAGDLSQEKVQALMLGFLRGALFAPSGSAPPGEVWEAELDRLQPAGGRGTAVGREVVGVAVWYLPGEHYVKPVPDPEKERAAAEETWSELLSLLERAQADWFLDYFLPRFAEMWALTLPHPGDTVDDHYHCHIVTTHPSYQNLGVLAHLLTPVFERAVKAGKRVLGEATSEVNRWKYEHMGCRRLGEVRFDPPRGSACGRWS